MSNVLHGIPKQLQNFHFSDVPSFTHQMNKGEKKIEETGKKNQNETSHPRPLRLKKGFHFPTKQGEKERHTQQNNNIPANLLKVFCDFQQTTINLYMDVERDTEREEEGDEIEGTREREF